jgi:ATP-dependent DNA helicase RecQ
LVLLEQSRLRCLAVDEAHCISEWGHDFRPEYRQLPEVRHRFPEAVCLALTATATARVRGDICQLLGIAREGQFMASFNRPNLFLRVERREKGLAQTLAFLERHRGESGIIYCSTRKRVDELAEDLKANGWPALPYHAGMDDALRRENQNRFTNDEVRLMVATIAFGMGINKPNVRFVLHYNLPKDLESYYQEIGRAGRDNWLSECLLLYSAGDGSKIRHFIFHGAEDQMEGREERLQAMMRFAETRQCRRVALLAYFGEAFNRSCCACDNCAPTPPLTVVNTATQVSAPEKPPKRRRNAAVKSLRPELFRRLQDLRKSLAAEESVPAFVVFWDSTLLEMTVSLPRDEQEFLATKGIGPAKLAKYGAQFIQVIERYCREQNL